MPRTPEGKVKDKVTAILREEGAYYFFPATFGLGRSGIPDIIACIPPYGRFFAVECKAGRNKPTTLQVQEIEAIRVHGGAAIVANEENWDTVREFVRKLKRERPS